MMYKTNESVYDEDMNNILKQLKKAMPKIAQKYDLSFVALFGSQASGKTHKNSDVDIAFYRNAPMDIEEELQMTYELSQVLHRSDLDMVNLHGAPPLLMREISDDGVVVYEKDAANFTFDEFQMYTFKRYVEAKPLFKMREESLKKFIQKHDRQTSHQV